MQGADRDRVTTALIDLGRQHGVLRIVLFGSRARGDARPRSDYDFALEAPGLNHSARSRLESAWADKKPTLLATDLVWLDDATPADLKASIAAEGITIYDAKA